MSALAKLGKAGAAIGSGGASAAKRLSGNLSSFKKTATTTLKKSADNAAALAKRSDSAADAGKASAKGADDVVGASAQTSKATKQLDTAADVGTDASKGAKKVDDVADAAKAGKKGVNATTVAKYTAAGGLAYYISEQIGAANEKVGDCIENCLPDNWTSYQYEEIGKDELNYKNLEECRNTRIKKKHCLALACSCSCLGPSGAVLAGWMTGSSMIFICFTNGFPVVCLLCS